MNKEKTALKYILYARKSSESEDRQMASIDSQIEELTKLAKENNIGIAEIMHESVSAKAPGRKIFNEMVEKLKKGEADGIICWKLNRLSRNPTDSGIISQLLQDEVVKHIFTFGRSYYPEDNVLVMAVEQGMANQFIRDLAVDTKRGLRAKAERGWYPCHAPLGYTDNPFKKKGEKEIIKDKKRFEIIQRMLKAVASGKYNPPETFKKAVKEWGLTNKEGNIPSLGTWYAIMNNSFYYGQYEYPKGSGNWYQGKHEPMITQGEFEKIQMLLGKRGTTRPRKYDFKYTGVAKCDNCGASITAEHKIKRCKNGNTHHYVYYHCTKRVDPSCDQKVIEEKKMEEEIIKVLKTIKIHPSFMDWAIKKLREENQEEIEHRKKIIENNKKEYENLKKRLDGLLDLRLNGELSEVEFRAKKDELSKQKTSLEAKLSDSEANSNWIDKLEDIKEKLTFAKDALDEFQKGDDDKRKEIFKAFRTNGSNLSLLDKKLSIKGNNRLINLVEVSSEVNSIIERFEPLESPEKKEKLELSYSSSSVLLRTLNEIRTFFSENPNAEF